MLKKRNPRKKKVVLIANTCWYIYNFRIKLLKEIQISNYELNIIAPYDVYAKKLKKFGYKVYDWNLKRSSLNPLLELIAIFNLIFNLRKINPDLVHNFTIKSCLYGTIAAKLSGVENIVNSVTGLGHLFINNSILIRLIRFTLKPIYFFVFNTKCSINIFQNSDDRRHFLKLGVLKDIRNSFIIEGSGVDTEFFKPFDYSRSKLKKTFRILFPSRIILEKGIKEVLEAHNSLLKKGENIQLLIAGEIDKGNRSAINKRYREFMLSQKNITILGHKKDLRQVYSQSDIVLLPSWREGLSKSLIEAGAMSKPIITTDTPGCRDIIDHGINGLLVPIKDSRSIELAILFLKRNKIIAEKFGQKIRSKVKKKFDVKFVNRQTIHIYRKLLKD